MSDLASRLSVALEGRYRVERELGEGGMATVFLADDLKHERQVALKVIKQEVGAVMGAERFLAEIKTTANLQHPHILPLFDSGDADGMLYYVMPYVEGESLDDRMRRESPMPIDEAVRMAATVAGALEYAHARGVVHRDVKPANILLQAGEPLVADFGIALAATQVGAERLTLPGTALGTPKYMSPEQAAGDAPVGPASDTYSLGSVLYEMLTGEAPFTGSARAIATKRLTQKPLGVRELRDTVPVHIAEAVDRAMARFPADRYRSIGEFAEALRGRRADTSAAPAPAPSPGSRAAPPRTGTVSLTQNRTRQLAAVWFADIVGYTSLSSTDEEGALAVVGELQQLAGESVEAMGGRIVKFVGDAVLTVFESTDAALKAALLLQESFSASEIVQGKGCALRIGVHLGEVVRAEDGDIYGDGVNLASRVEGMAAAGQIVITEDVWRQIRQREDLPSYRLGPKTLKGVAEPVQLWALGVGEDAPSTAPVTSSSRGPVARAGGAARLFPSVVALVTVLAAGVYLAGRAGETRAELVGLVATQVGFVVSTPARGSAASTASAPEGVPFTQPVPAREVLVDRVGGVYVPPAARPDGTPYPGGNYAADILLVAAADGGAVQWDPLEVPVGTSVVARAAVGADGFEIVTDRGDADVKISLRGPVSVTVPGGIDEVLDFGPGGGQLSVAVAESGFTVGFIPAGAGPSCQDCAGLVLNLPVSQLDLSTVDETVELESSTAQRVSTVHGGMLSLPGLEQKLQPSEVVRFATFEGEIGRMDVGQDSLRLDAAATRAAGIRSSLVDDLMPTRFAVMGTGQRIAWGTGLAVFLLFLFLVAPRFSRTEAR